MHKTFRYTICNKFLVPQTPCVKKCVYNAARRCTQRGKHQENGIFFFLPCLCRSSGWFPGRAALSAVPVLSPGTRPAGWGGPRTRPPTTEAKAKRERCQVRARPGLPFPYRQVRMHRKPWIRCGHSGHDSGDRWRCCHQAVGSGIEGRTSVQRPQDEWKKEEGKAGSRFTQKRNPAGSGQHRTVSLPLMPWNLPDEWGTGWSVAASSGASLGGGFSPVLLNILINSRRHMDSAYRS